jgi:DNA-binding SARP family transcriptional activator
MRSPANLLSFALLGTPEVRFNSAPVVLPTRKALALLIYLAVERHSHAREQVMTLFWPDSDLERAQMSLRTTLLYIRKAVPHPALRFDRDTVMLDLSEEIEVDTERLKAAARAAARPQLRQSALMPSFQAALRDVRGEFLSGFGIDDAADFDHWLSIQREFFHQQVVAVFDALSHLQLELAQYHDGLSTTTRWIDLAPYDEVAYQRQMQFHLASGNRIAALQAYKSVSLMLRNEFGVAPTPQTQALERQAHAPQDGDRRRLDPEAECIALNRMAMSISQSSYDLDQALDLLRQALHLAMEIENPLHRAETHWNLAQTYFYRGSIESALQHAGTALVTAREVGRDGLVGRILNTIAYANLWSAVPLTTILPGVDEAIALFARLQQPALQVDCLTIKANAYLACGYPEDGLRCALEALHLSETLQNDWGMASASYNLGLAFLDSGETSRAGAICAEGVMHARTAGHPPLIFFNLLVLGHVQRDTDDTDAALRTHLEAQEMSDSLRSPYFQLLILTELCADFMRLNQIAQAAECALKAQALRARVPYSDYTRWHDTSALLAHAHDEAASHERLLVEEQLRHDPNNRRLRYGYERILAAWAHADGDLNATKAHLAQAVTYARDFGFSAELRDTERALQALEASE